jgi:hypothetical protein
VPVVTATGIMRVDQLVFHSAQIAAILEEGKR